MGTTKQRKERLQHIIEVLKAAPDQKLAFNELYAPLVLEWGITEATMRNYLDSLETAKLVSNGRNTVSGLYYGWLRVYLVGGEGHRRIFNPTPEEKAQDEAIKETFMKRTAPEGGITIKPKQ